MIFLFRLKLISIIVLWVLFGNSYAAYIPITISEDELTPTASSYPKNLKTQSVEVFYTEIANPYVFNIFFKNTTSYSSAVSHLSEVNETYHQLISSDKEFVSFIKSANIVGGIVGNYSYDEEILDGYYGVFPKSLIRLINSSSVIDFVAQDYINVYVDDISVQNNSTVCKLSHLSSDISPSETLIKRDISSLPTTTSSPSQGFLYRKPPLQYSITTSSKNSLYKKPPPTDIITTTSRNVFSRKPEKPFIETSKVDQGYMIVEKNGEIIKLPTLPDFEPLKHFNKKQEQHNSNNQLQYLKNKELPPVPIQKPHQKATRVFVLDSGIDYTHEGIAGSQDLRVEQYFNNLHPSFIEDEHGTSVAYCALQKNPNTLVIDVKINIANGCNSDANIISGIYYAIKTHNLLKKTISDYAGSVINLSYNKDLGIPSPGLDQAVAAASKAGITVVNSAGNHGLYNSNSLLIAGNNVEFISVGALDVRPYSIDIAPFSNRQPDISVYADGVGCQVPILNTFNKYTHSSGTSFAAPYVSGTISYLLEKLSERGFDTSRISAEHIRKALESSSDKYTSCQYLQDYRALLDYSKPENLEVFIKDIEYYGYSAER